MRQDGSLSYHLHREHTSKNQGALGKNKKEQGAKKNDKGAEKKLKGSKHEKMQGSRERWVKV